MLGRQCEISDFRREVTDIVHSSRALHSIGWYTWFNVQLRRLATQGAVTAAALLRTSDLPEICCCHNADVDYRNPRHDAVYVV
jgi:hypothetical protein